MINTQNETILEILPLQIHSVYQSLLLSILSSKNEDFQKVLPGYSWPQFQLFDCYHHLCRLLLKEEITPNLSIIQLENGAIPLQAKGYISWASNIHQPFHAEMGVLLALYGFYSKKIEYIKQAHQAALWQMQILDRESIPFFGMFTQEEFAQRQSILEWSYLLFHLVGQLLDQPEMNFIAQKQKAFFLAKGFKFSSIVSSIESFFPKQSSQSFEINKTIHDPLSRLVGIRSEKFTSLSTINGGGTGLGTFMKNSQLGFITFGPQYLPYGENQCFGIESSHLHNDIYPFNIKHHDGSEYEIHGYARLPGKQMEFSYQWIEISQKLTQNKLDISVNFLSLEECTDLSFVFYVSAQECKIGNDIKIKTKSFSKYKGKPLPIQFFDHNENKITLEVSNDIKEMEIIPLAGENVFWSGDFLVGFHLDLSSKTTWSLILD